MKIKEVHLKQYFTGAPSLEYFDIVSRDLPSPGEGEVRVQNLWLSVDPYMRPRMAGLKTYIDPFEIGKAMEGGAVGIIESSNHPKFKVGDHVLSMLGWREGYVSDGKGLTPVDTRLLPVETYLGLAGLTGFTAYVGLTRILDLKDGETIWISAGAGAVGCAAIQMAKAMGAHVIASAGGAEKCALLKELGCDGVIDYKAEDNLTAAVKREAPGGIDAYFENVGGAHLEAALNTLKPLGRIAACGMISRYNDDRAQPGPSNIINVVTKSLRMQGFIVTQHMDLQPRFIEALSTWMMKGQIKNHQTIYEGIERAPEAFMGLFSGSNTGKMVVKV
ncbi:NADP-dependent oxidoreductase [Woodsholea maritima]|uniref:NADP-dependent oxidoreductase n=1 Tax=Woodsholea maritima TaxID=240237 RepID=UPI000374E3E5|nr:NADP-dependent oxidoreductase [Woodsholea maritima]